MPARKKMTVELPVFDNGRAVAKVLKLPELPPSKRRTYDKWGIEFEEFEPGTPPERRQKVAATVWALHGQVETPGAVFLVTVVPNREVTSRAARSNGGRAATRAASGKGSGHSRTRAAARS